MSLTASAKALRLLDLQSYRQKSITWAGERPVPTGVRLANDSSFPAHRLTTDGRGNVLSMPLLVGKPCFGIPTAYLRHGRAKATYVARMKERVHNSRCDRCEIKPVCIQLVKERLRAVAMEQLEFRTLLREWSDAGGFEQGGFALGFKKMKRGGWTRFAHFLHEAEFTSTNDGAVENHWAEKHVRARKAAEARARSTLREDWKNGRRLSVLIEGLDAGFQERATLLREALSSAQPPRYLMHVRSSSVERICSVWWGREFARLSGRKINPNSIAQCMIERGRDLGKSKSVLRDAVKSDMKRIRKLEANAQYNGGTAIWPAFKHHALQQSLHFSGA